MTLVELKEARAKELHKEHKPLVYTCARCKLGVADPKIFLNGNPMHFPICFPNRLVR